MLWSLILVLGVVLFVLSASDRPRRVGDRRAEQQRAQQQRNNSHSACEHEQPTSSAVAKMDSADGVIDLMTVDSSSVDMSSLVAHSAQHSNQQTATNEPPAEAMEVDTPITEPKAGPNGTLQPIKTALAQASAQFGLSALKSPVGRVNGHSPSPGPASTSTNDNSPRPHSGNSRFDMDASDRVARTELPTGTTLSAAFSAYEALDADSDEEVRGAAQRRKGKSKAISSSRAVAQNEEEWDDRLYCICQSHYNGQRPMIACDLCEEWFHTDCVNIDDDRVELVDQFICPNCEKVSPERTTWKAQCARPDCPNPVVPLSKYCTDYCGIEVAALRLEMSGQDPERFREELEGASRREAAVVPTRAARRMAIDQDDSSAAIAREAQETQRAQDRRTSRTLQSNLERLVERKREMVSHRDMVESRLRYLCLARRRWLALCIAAAASVVTANGAEAETTTTKSKSKVKKTAGGPTTAPTALCGFDVLLVMENEDWASWVDSEESQQPWALQPELVYDEAGQEIEQDYGPLSVDGLNGQSGVCFDSKRKCERHKDWQELRRFDYKLEKVVLEERIARLAEHEMRLCVQLEEHEAGARFRAEYSGRTDANPLNVDEADSDGASRSVSPKGVRKRPAAGGTKKLAGLSKRAKSRTESPATEDGAGGGALGVGAAVPESLLAAGLSRAELARLKRQGAF